MHPRSELPDHVPPSSDSAAAIAAEAAQWIARTDRGLTPDEQQSLDNWARADPRHAAELDRLGGAWHWLDGARDEPGLTELADEFYQRARGRRVWRRTVRYASLTMAAAAVLVVGYVGKSRWSAPDPARDHLSPELNYHVLASTLRRLTLPDGSIAELNGSSRIEVNFSGHERRVRLVEGEAHFVVAKNPARPFYVSAGSVSVRAVGTAFNVILAADKIEVLVTEGTVKIQPLAPVTATDAVADLSTGIDATPALVQGQRAVIDRGAVGAGAGVAVGDVGAAEIDEALGWQTTRLVFNNTPLDEVVAGFNRYNRHRLTLGDSKLRHRTLTGTFRADNLDGFIRLLRDSIDVKAELRIPGETVLLPMR